MPAQGGQSLTARSRDNLVAFARLYGYVRWFHPSEQSLSADWTAIAVEGARQVEAAASPERLVSALQQVFGPVAPTVRLFQTSGAPSVTPPVATPDAATTGIAFWSHRGVRIGQNSFYTSHRTVAPAGERPANAPDPSQPWRLELKGGVTALVPGSLYLPLPADSAARARQPAIDTVLARYAATDRAARFGALIIAWNVAQHFYPYFDVFRIDWTGALQRALDRAAPDQSQIAFEAVLRRMMAELKDGHALVIIQPWREMAMSPFLASWIEQRLVVTAVDSSVAGKLSLGDVITRFNGEAIERVLARQDSFSQGSSPANIRYVSTIQLLAGEPNSAFTIDVERGRGAPARGMEVRRTLPMPPGEPRPSPVAEIRPGIWYFDLTRSRDTMFAAALPQLSQAKGVVFDMRGYPSVSRRFLQHLFADTTRWGTRQMSMPVILQPDHQGMSFVPAGTWVLGPLTPRISAPVVFLADERAGSYAESLLDLISEHKLGTIVGSNSAGTNGDMNWFIVPGGYRVAYTGLKVVRHDGTTLHGVGIEPMVRVAPTIAGLRAGRDEVLEKGVEVLAGKR